MVGECGERDKGKSIILAMLFHLKKQQFLYVLYKVIILTVSNIMYNIKTKEKFLKTIL